MSYIENDVSTPMAVLIMESVIIVMTVTTLGTTI